MLTMSCRGSHLGFRST